MSKLVFTNGCFDLLHAGHINILSYCRSLSQGGHVVVAINSDSSIKRLKGKDRPIFEQGHRMQMLNSMRDVDMVCIFEDDTPYNLIKTLKPDIIVKGPDYEGVNVVGSDLAEVKILPSYMLRGSTLELSTTNIIKKIKELP